MKTARLIVLLVLGIALLSVSAPHACQAQTATSWTAAGSSSDWFLPSNWTNGAPTSVIYAGDAEISGSNSYTGMTYVVGNPGDTVTVTNYRARPNGVDVDISGYSELYLRDLRGNSAYALGDVAIRDGATLSIGCCGNGDTLTAKSIVLEGGRLSAPLVGSMPITKQTEGAAIISQPSPGFTGNIEVLEGTLQAGEGGSYGYLAFGSGTVDVLPQGRLALTSINAPTNAPNPNIRLQGGSLFGIGNAGDSGINLRGALDVLDDSAIYLLAGTLDRPRASTIRLDGSNHVAAGKSLSILGRPDDSVGLHVTQGLQLDDGAILAGDGVIRARIDISRGAILSPGSVDQNAKVGLLATDTPSSVVDLPKSRMSWGTGGRYRWEINDADGDAGAPFGSGWDVMRIGSILDITATPSAPFILEPVPLGNRGEPDAVAGLIPNRQYRWLIAEIGKINAFSATITGFAADKFTIDLSNFRDAHPNIRSSDFWLDLDSTGIHLNAKVIPEPACFTLVILALGVCFRQRSLRPTRRDSECRRSI